jgi:hypothetical protein
MTDASGDVPITGVGFTPKLLIFHYGIAGTKLFGVGSTAIAGNTGTHGTFSATGDTGNTLTENILVINAVTTTGASQTAYVKSFDTDGFTLTWAKTGSPTGSLGVYVTAIG